MSAGALDAPVTVRHTDGVTWVTLNRPAEANTVNLALAHAFHDAVVDTQRHGAAAVVIAAVNGAAAGGGLGLASATGERLDAVSAERIGLVHGVFPATGLLDAAGALAAGVASRPAGHLAATRRLHRGDHDAYRRHLEAEARTIAAAARTPEAERLIRAFAATATAGDSR